jgi:hemolysin type calcium-binding protein
MIKRFLSATAAGCLLLATNASAAVTCSYEKVSPRSSYLEIVGDEIEDQAAIRRSGQSIRVIDDASGTPVSCAGPTPTVRNIARILFIAKADGAGLFVSLAGGPFAPGLDDSSASSEIQIQARTFAEFPGNIGLGGSRGTDRFQIRSQRPTGRTLVNFDPGKDNEHDLVFPASVVGFLVRGGRGDDSVVGSGIRGRLSLSVYAGPGRDRLVGGPFTDFLAGRAGADFIRGRGGADEINCGSGTDVALIEPRDRVAACENRRAERPLAFP